MFSSIILTLLMGIGIAPQVELLMGEQAFSNVAVLLAAIGIVVLNFTLARKVAAIVNQ
ncbi:MAG: hypothetical protein ACOC32_00360 [Nanoarchaeota archaeon]